MSTKKNNEDINCFEGFLFPSLKHTTVFVHTGIKAVTVSRRNFKQI
jgi:hypothetical protein